MTRFKIIVFAIVAILLVIVVLQNTETVETKFLLLTIPMPRAVLLFVTALGGFVLGLVAAFGFSRKSKEAKT